MVGLVLSPMADYVFRQKSTLSFASARCSFLPRGDYFSEVKDLVVHEEYVSYARNDTRGDTRR